jgi:hypothetical protein
MRGPRPRGRAGGQATRAVGLGQRSAPSEWEPAALQGPRASAPCRQPECARGALLPRRTLAASPLLSAWQMGFRFLPEGPLHVGLPSVINQWS